MDGGLHIHSCSATASYTVLEHHRPFHSMTKNHDNGTGILDNMHYDIA